MTQHEAERIALLALGWLAAQEDLIGVFLGSSGMTPDDLKMTADQPETCAAVLDFIVMDDMWVRDFAQDQSIPPERVMQARAVLPGGALPHWT